VQDAFQERDPQIIVKIANMELTPGRRSLLVMTFFLVRLAYNSAKSGRLDKLPKCRDHCGVKVPFSINDRFSTLPLSQNSD
jgi:hypothetical protein